MLALPPQAEKPLVISMSSLEGMHPPVGTITIRQTSWGLLLTPKLEGLPEGVHGFHIHEKPDCGLQGSGAKEGSGMAAGGHFDPDDTESHKGPYGPGHLGDLPVLIVNSDGTATTPVLAPRLRSIQQIHNRSLMIHGGGDNYSDTPKLGGGGARIACGVIP